MSRRRGKSTRWDEARILAALSRPVCLDGLSKRARSQFDRNVRIIELYLVGDVPLDVICRRCNTSTSSIDRLRRRFEEPHPDGEPFGLLACIPRYRIKPYKLKNHTPRSRAGAFEFLLERHPAVRDELDAIALGRKKIAGRNVHGRGNIAIWRAFRAICDQAGIDIREDYPFSNADQGKEAVRNYVRKVRDSDFRATALTVHGVDAARLAAFSGEPPERAVATRPYERWAADGHLIDQVVTLGMQDNAGDYVYLPMARIWIVFVIDERSGAIMGYFLSLAHTYNMNDVLMSVRTALEPWQAMTLPEGFPSYKSGAGLPSGVVEGCAWRVPDTLKLDNALAHTSAWIQEKLLGAGMLEIVTNKARSPRSNTRVERTVGTIASVMHQLPNSTGTGPKDPRRQDPDGAAIALQIDLEDLRMLTDVIIANYNATPCELLNGRSPLEYLRYRMTQGRDLPRYAIARTTHGLRLFEREFAVTVRADPANGHRPYIKFYHLRYTGEGLREGLKYRNKKATLRIDVNDIRYGELFVGPNSLGRVQAPHRWRLRAHSIRDRQAVYALIKESRLDAAVDDPVGALYEYKRNRAPLTRRDRSEIAAAKESPPLEELHPEIDDDYVVEAEIFPRRPDYHTYEQELTGLPERVRLTKSSS